MTEVREGPDEDATSLGEGHAYKFFQDASGQRIGLFEWHRTPEGTWCCGGVYFEGADERHQSQWKVETWEPLTLSPSLLCGNCTSHGFIRDGKWVEA